MVIQSVLAFILGFLAAGLIAILIAPAYRRRAERLTRQRLEATLPMSLNEMQAERDRVRAEYAVALRRVEADAKVQKTKANERMVESARLSEQLKVSEQASSDRSAAIAARDVTIADLQARLAAEREAVAGLKEKLSVAERNLADKSLAYEDLSRLHEEATLVASNRQIDLLSRDAEIDRLSATVTQLRTQRGENEQKVREQSAAELRISEDLKTERRRVVDLEAKLERLMRDLSDREEAIERRDRTILQLRGQSVQPTAEPKTGSDYAAQAQVEAGADAASRELVQLGRDLRRAEQTEQDLRLELTQVQSTAMRLEAELADNAVEPHLVSVPHSTDLDAALVRLEADRDRLESQLLALAAENDRLRQHPDGKNPAESAAAPGVVAGGGLRDDLAQIAAQMVHMTRVLEGPGSPIDTALATPVKGAGKPGVLTLADRIRALQQAASVAEPSEPVQRDR